MYDYRISTHPTRLRRRLPPRRIGTSAITAGRRSINWLRVCLCNYCLVPVPCGVPLNSRIPDFPFKTTRLLLVVYFKVGMEEIVVLVVVGSDVVDPFLSRSHSPNLGGISTNFDSLVYSLVLLECDSVRCWSALPSVTVGVPPTLFRFRDPAHSTYSDSHTHTPCGRSCRRVYNTELIY